MAILPERQDKHIATFGGGTNIFSGGTFASIGTGTTALFTTGADEYGEVFIVLTAFGSLSVGGVSFAINGSRVPVGPSTAVVASYPNPGDAIRTTWLVFKNSSG